MQLEHSEYRPSIVGNGFAVFRCAAEEARGDAGAGERTVNYMASSVVGIRRDVV